MQYQPSSQVHLDVVVQWLNAIRQGQLQLSEETFSILRHLGQIVRNWEQANMDEDSEFLPDAEFEILSASAQVILQQVSPFASEYENPSIPRSTGLDSAIVAQGTSDAADLDFNLLLQALDRALGSMLLLLQEWLVNLEDPAKVAAVAQGFKALRELSDGERLADVTEVAWALENMLDRLVDGTLAVNGDFHKVATAAMNFLVTLSDKLSRISAGAAVSSFIDDYIYAEIIESADILASGGDLGLKSQEFEEEFPSEQSLDSDKEPGLASSEYDESKLDLENSLAADLTFSLEQTVEVFQAANLSLEASLLKHESLHSNQVAGLNDEGRRLAHVLRRHLLSGREVSAKLLALISLSRQQSD
jgi:chemotaxis protein histidine kinase CheA